MQLIHNNYGTSKKSAYTDNHLMASFSGSLVGFQHKYGYIRDEPLFQGNLGKLAP